MATLARIGGLGKLGTLKALCDDVSFKMGIAYGSHFGGGVIAIRLVPEAGVVPRFKILVGV